MVTDTSATGSTVVDAFVALLTRAGSNVLADTLAWFVIVPDVVGVTLIWTLVLAPFASAPRLQVTVPLAWLQVPWFGVADTNVTPPGSVSVTDTPVAPDGPALLIPSV